MYFPLEYRAYPCHSERCMSERHGVGASVISWGEAAGLTLPLSSNGGSMLHRNSLWGLRKHVWHVYYGNFCFEDLGEVVVG